MSKTSIRILLSNPIEILSVSTEIEELLGFQVDDINNGSIRLIDRIHPHDHDISEKIFSTDHQYLEGSFNIRLRHASGKIQCVKGLYSKVKDESSEFLLLNLELTDARQLWVGAIEQDNATNFKAMMENTDDYIYFKDRNHVFTGASETLVDLTDPSEHWQDLLGLTDYDVFPEEYADNYYKLEKQIFSGIKIAHEEQEIFDNDGNLGWVDNRKYPIYDDNGDIIGLFGIARDITSEKKLQQELLAKDQEQSEILDSMVDAVITIDEHGLITNFNHSAETLFGYDAAEVKDQNISMLMPEPNSGHHDGYLKKYIETGDAQVIGIGRQVHGLKKNKQLFPMHLSVAELPTDKYGVRRFIGSCQDLTLIQEQEEQVRRSQKIDALGKLTGGIAHDFNNLLSVIMGYADLLAHKLTAESKLIKYASEIRHASERGAEMTKKLLLFTKDQSSEDVKFNINQLILEQQDLLQKTLTVRIALNLDLVEDIWSVWLDKSELEDSILNICINAMHAMENSKSLSEIKISTRNESLNKIEAERLELKAGDFVLLSISDTGSGMNEEILSKLFDPFFTTKGNFGTGLGLTQVFGFIRRSSAAIKVYSEVDHGTKFVMYFPRFIDVSETSGESKVVEKNLSGRESILIVDDEIKLCDLTAELLRDQGYKVFCAYGGVEALGILENQKVELLFTDILMPKMDGYQLASIVKDKYPFVKIQLASGFSDEENITLVDKNLNDNILQKPYNSELLFKTIRDMLDD